MKSQQKEDPEAAPCGSSACLGGGWDADPPWRTPSASVTMLRRWNFRSSSVKLAWWPPELQELVFVVVVLFLPLDSVCCSSTRNWYSPTWAFANNHNIPFHWLSCSMLSGTIEKKYLLGVASYFKRWSKMNLFSRWCTKYADTYALTLIGSYEILLVIWQSLKYTSKSFSWDPSTCLTVADVALGFLRQERVVNGRAEARLVVKVFVPVSPGLWAQNPWTLVKPG